MQLSANFCDFSLLFNICFLLFFTGPRGTDGDVGLSGRPGSKGMPGLPGLIGFKGIQATQNSIVRYIKIMFLPGD